MESPRQRRKWLIIVTMGIRASRRTLRSEKAPGQTLSPRRQLVGRIRLEVVIQSALAPTKSTKNLARMSKVLALVSLSQREERLITETTTTRLSRSLLRLDTDHPLRRLPRLELGQTRLPFQAPQAVPVSTRLKKNSATMSRDSDSASPNLINKMLTIAITTTHRKESLRRRGIGHQQPSSIRKVQGPTLSQFRDRLTQ